MIKKNNKRNKIIMWGLIATASISLASVGFASFVINQNVSSTVDGVAISVGAVSNQSITAAASEVAIDSKTGLSFDNVATGTEGQKVTNGDEKVEKLSFKIKTTLTITDGDFSSLLTNLTFTFSDTLDSAVTDGYITMPFAKDNKQTITFSKADNADNQFNVSYTNDTSGVSVDGLNGNVYTFSAGSKEINITTTFTCGWGSNFFNDNPGKITLGSENNETNKTLTVKEFTTRISTLKDAVNGKKLTVTVTPNGN